MGLNPGSLGEGFNIRRVDGISNMQPRSPLSGNDYFLGLVSTYLEERLNWL